MRALETERAVKGANDFGGNFGLVGKSALRWASVQSVKIAQERLGHKPGRRGGAPER